MELLDFIPTFPKITERRYGEDMPPRKQYDGEKSFDA